ncbi:hybrid sensor histidine kinase/response regulator [Pleurocapsa sp. PCC 7319]|uniref:hybrid sensor histidine kinase/response regulator n=1 Tax=Pleurocapsa sp. PCC 7319 TaxID=118161 RepID=UPI00034D1ABA|nr:hybrid sensor histidine kinase/response regulator [Pleurocapsa sp. PCC 7319]
MSDSSGSILQLQPKATALSNLNLLIASNNGNDIEAIAKPLYSAGIDLTYEVISVDKLVDKLPRQKYSAILYDYFPVSNLTTVNTLTEQLQLWCNLCPQTPFILITDALGDELAVELIQSGVSGYILRQKLYKLPDVLENTLFNFFSKQTIIAQQLDLINQQQKKIKELEAEKQKLLNQEKAKQEHLSHLNHELRSPISSMLGFAGMLKEQYYGPLNSKQLQYVSALLTVGQHLLDLVNNYLDLAKIDANKQTLDLERLAVSEICQASLFIVADQAKQKGLELIYEQGDNIDFCTADSIRLKQILVNLLSNAIKFTNEGSIILQVQLEQDLLYFAVIDTGIGISTENLSKLFKPFPQITNHHESTGLGLALSQKLAQLHGGDITVTSKLGKGSCFTLWLPQHQ